MSWQIRPARPEDADRISEIIVEALGYSCTPEDVRRRLPEVLARPTDRVFVACRTEDGRIGGYVHAADYETIYNGSMKNILALAVAGSARSLGLGRMLVDAVEAWAAECNCVAVRLVSGHNRTGAHAFYEHCGYFMRKEQKNFIKYLNA